MLEELFCAHRAELTAYCRGLCRSDAAAQDMVQEVFLRAWQNIGTLQDLGPSQRRAWLYRTARNLFVDAMRRTAREAAALPELEPEPETPDPDFAEAEARRLLELLTPAEQELFRKRYLEGYTAAELGKMYGLPPATVRTRLDASGYWSPGWDRLVLAGRAAAKKDNDTAQKLAEALRADGEKLCNDCVLPAAAYDVIEVRANVVVLNDRAKELIARYPVTLKCDLATDNPNIALRSVNGVAEVTPCDVPEADTVLTVNGELKIASGSAEVLARYLQITVNGQVYCPRSLSGKLGNVAVNGQIITWPDGAVQLKNTAVLDSTFALRAKPALYWAARCVVMLDPALDVAALAKQGVRFDTPRAILAQSLATQAAPLFEDDTDLEIVPDGTAYLKDDAELTAALIRRKGNKLYVDGRLTLTAESAALLPQLEYCKVTGTALVPAAQEKAFSASCVQAEKVQTVRGRLLQGQGRVQVDYWMLEAPDGLCVKGCGMVALTPELEPELIAAKLMLLECGMVQCTAAQKGAVQLVAKDVGFISDDSGKPTEDTDTHMVRADRYVM